MANNEVKIKLSADGQQVRNEIKLIDRDLQELGGGSVKGKASGNQGKSSKAADETSSNKNDNKPSSTEKVKQESRDKVNTQLLREMTLVRKELQKLNGTNGQGGKPNNGGGSTPPPSNDNSSNPSPTPPSGDGNDTTGKLGNLLGKLAIAAIALKGASAAWGYISAGAQASASGESLAYRTYGSTLAYTDYYTAKKDAKNLGSPYGYDYETVMGAGSSNMAKAGFTTIDNYNKDMTALLSTSKAWGLDASSLASASGYMTSIGVTESGDQKKFADLLAESIVEAEMTGMGNEQLQVLEQIAENLASRNASVSSDQLTGSLGMYNALINQNENLKGARGADMVTSMQDLAASGNMSLDILAGFGTKYTGLSGQLELRKLAEENPEQYWSQVYAGVQQYNLGDDYFKKLLYDNVGSVSQAEEIMSSLPEIAQGTYKISDTTKGEEETQKRIENYDKADVSTQEKYEIEKQDTKETAGEGLNNLLKGWREWYSGLSDGAKLGVTAVNGAASLAGGAGLVKGGKALWNKITGKGKGSPSTGTGTGGTGGAGETGTGGSNSGSSGRGSGGTNTESSGTNARNSSSSSSGNGTNAAANSTDEAINSAANATDEVASTATNSVDEAVNGASNSVDKITNAASSSADDAAGATSRTLANSGDDLANAAANSVDEVGEAAANSIDDMASNVANSIDEAAANAADDLLANSADDVVSNVADDVVGGGLKGMFGKALGPLVQLGFGAYNYATANDDWERSGAVGQTGGGILGGILGGFAGPLGSIAGGWAVGELGEAAGEQAEDGKKNYGSIFAGDWNLLSGLWKKDGTLVQQDLKKKSKSKAESEHGGLPSDYGLPKVFDEHLLSDNGDINWSGIETALSSENSFYRKQMENKYGMTYDELEKWKDSDEYKEYQKYADDKAKKQEEKRKKLDAQSIYLKEGDEGYDSSLDTDGNGYSVWTGTQKELDSWLKDQTFITDGSPSQKGDMDMPYMMNELSDKSQEAIAKNYGTDEVVESNTTLTDSVDSLSTEISEMRKWLEDNGTKGTSVWTDEAVKDKYNEERGLSSSKSSSSTNPFGNSTSTGSLFSRFSRFNLFNMFKSHAVGDDYIPYDNYLASLHRGEMVLNKADADDYRQGKARNSDNQVSGQSSSIDININLTGDVRGMTSENQNKIAEAVASKIKASDLQNMISNGFTRVQNY